MFGWKKLGHLFNPADLTDSWMVSFAQSPSVILFENYFRVFFSSRPSPDEKGNFVSRLAFADFEKASPFKIVNICSQPILSLGSRGTFDEFGTYPVSTIKDDHEIRVYYAGWTRCESVPFNAAIGVAFSRDGGEHFERRWEGPVLSYTPDEPFVIGSPKVRRFDGVWYLWYSSGRSWTYNNGAPQPVYKIRMAYSKDGFEWIRVGRNLISDKLESAECQASPDVFFHEGKYHMFFSYRYQLGYRTLGRGYRIGYAYSHDLNHWTRDDAAVGIAPSEAGWDSESVSYGHVFEMTGDTYMLYQGNEMGKYGFGIAILEKD